MADIAQAAIECVAAAERSADAARVAATSAAATAARSRDVGQVVQELVQELTQERAKNVLLQSRLDAAEAQIHAQMLGIAEGRQEKGALESKFAALRRDYDDQQVAFAEERRGLIQSRLDSEQRLPGVSSRGPPEPRLARPEQKKPRRGSRGSGWIAATIAAAAAPSSAQGQEPIWTPATIGVHPHPAGWKVHSQDLPAEWMGGNDLERWFGKMGVAYWAESNCNMPLSKFGRWQAILTFDTPDKARHAKNALDGFRLEVDKHVTTAKYFASRSHH